VVFYTRITAEPEARALSMGVFDVLTKPAESREVLTIVCRVLSDESETGDGTRCLFPHDGSPPAVHPPKYV
jgi:DNA-binding response OmpR family regulator